MAYPLTGGGAQHFVTRKLGMTTVQLTVNAESTDTIAVDVQLSDVAGNSISSADAWGAVVVGETGTDLVALPFTLAETGGGTELGNTARAAITFTLSAAGAAAVTVTDVAGASGDTVILYVFPLDSMAVPAYATVTFD